MSVPLLVYIDRTFQRMLSAGGLPPGLNGFYYF